jgi:hypothetical protein
VVSRGVLSPEQATRAAEAGRADEEAEAAERCGGGR